MNDSLSTTSLIFSILKVVIPVETRIQSAFQLFDYEKPSIGILLFHSKKDELVELTCVKNTNIHASEYQLYLPTKEELRKQMVEAQKDWEEHHA